MRFLIPIDFSASSESALSYCLQLAKLLSAEVIVLHAYPLQPKSAFISLTDIIELEKKADQEAGAKLAEFIGRFAKKNPHLDLSRTTQKTRLGFAVENVISITETEDIQLVVMGTKGAGDIQTRLLGTNTSVVIDNVDVPVIAVPAGAEDRMPKTIVWATDLKTQSLKDLGFLSLVSKAFSSTVHLLHVVHGGEYTAPEEIERIMKSAAESLPDVELQFDEAVDDDKEAGIVRFINEKNADLLIMTKRQRTLFDRVFGTSSTRHMSQFTQLPLMAFHAK